MPRTSEARPTCAECDGPLPDDSDILCAQCSWAAGESAHPKVGDWALHKSNLLDAREVAHVSEDGELIWIQIGSLPPTGPLLAKNYTYTPANETKEN